MTPAPGTAPAPAPGISTIDAPAAIAESITGRPYLSWSQITSFRGCPRAFAFKYIEQAEPAFTSSSLVFGGAIHSALQHHYEQLMQGVQTAQADLLEVYRTAWAQRQSEGAGVPIRYGDGEGPDTLAELAERMLTAFCASDLAHPAGAIVAIEEQLQGTLADDLPPLLAYVDLIIAEGAVLRLIDMKTSRAKWSEAKVAEQAEQVRLYRHLAEDLAADGQTINLAFAVITKTKQPAVQHLPVAEGDADRDARTAALVDIVRPVWAAMTLGVDFTSPGGFNCVGCAYRHKCPAHRAPGK